MWEFHSRCFAAKSAFGNFREFFNSIRPFETIDELCLSGDLASDRPFNPNAIAEAVLQADEDRRAAIDANETAQEALTQSTQKSRVD